MVLFLFFLCLLYRDHPDLHVLTHSSPTRRSSDLLGIVVDSRGAPGLHKANDIGALLRELPTWCARSLDRRQLRLVYDLARDLEAARWRLPDEIGRAHV